MLRKVQKSKVRLMSAVLSALLVSTSLTVFADTTTASKKSTSGSMIGTTTIIGAESDGESGLLSGDALNNVTSQLGSIEITLSDGKTGTSKEGVGLSCVKVADIENGSYVLDSTYKSTSVDLNNIKNASQLEAAATKISKMVKEENVATTDLNGYVIYSDLEVGVYLIKATDDSKYDDITPLLVSVPTFDETINDMSYEITVVPKHTAKTEKKSLSTGKNAPQTNVNSPVVLYFGGAALVLLVLICTNVFYKKSRK